jgi:hypothetical protein
MTNILAQIQARKDEFDFEALSVFKERSTDFKEDPLVLACAAKKLSDEGKPFAGLQDPETLDSITDDLRVYAETVRDYYTKKYFWKAMSGGNLSDYRRRLINLLENRIKSCSDKDCGIYFKLPYFFEEDMIYDTFTKKYNTTDVPSVRYGINASKEDLSLTFLKSTVSRQQKRKIERFWFTDQTYLFCVAIDQSNPLMEMFRKFLEESETVHLQAFRTADRIDNMHFYNLYKFNFKRI